MGEADRAGTPPVKLGFGAGLLANHAKPVRTIQYAAFLPRVTIPFSHDS